MGPRVINYDTGYDMITDKVNSSRKFGADVARSRYGKVDRVKMCQKNYSHDMSMATSSGKIEVINVLLQSHLDNPYTSVEELMGDIQLLAVHSWNELHSLNPKSFVPTNIERILKDVSEKSSNTIQ